MLFSCCEYDWLIDGWRSVPFYDAGMNQNGQIIIKARRNASAFNPIANAPLPHPSAGGYLPPPLRGDAKDRENYGYAMQRLRLSMPIYAYAQESLML
jgi:hypothetical protein